MLVVDRVHAANCIPIYTYLLLHTAISRNQAQVCVKATCDIKKGAIVGFFDRHARSDTFINQRADTRHKALCRVSKARVVSVRACIVPVDRTQVSVIHPTLLLTLATGLLPIT